MTWFACTSALPSWSVFSLVVVRDGPGFALLKAAGRGAARFFRGESGGHRWQRIPPTEKRGRVQTSTVTVAAIEGDGAPDARLALDPRDLEVTYYRASGKGGQNRNKRDTAARVLHRPSGIVCTCADERSQGQNLRRAKEALRARLEAQEASRRALDQNRSRRAQIGSGMRGDKVRTYRARDDRVVDHVTGRRTRLSKLEKGDWHDLKDQT